MEKEKDVFRFEDFIDVDRLNKMKSNLIKEGILGEDDDDVVDLSKNPYGVSSIVEPISDEVDYDAVADAMRQSYGDAVMNNVEDFEDSDSYTGTTDTAEYIDQFSTYMNFHKSGESVQDYEDEEHFDFHNESVDDYYNLYKDKSEDFVCDIAVEGVSPADTEARLIIESDEWTLMFKGDIKSGKCVIPIKKLSILQEGQKGTIKLEVNADGTLFTPWEDNFVVKASKKVTVSVNEGRKAAKKKPAVSNKPAVSVKVRK